MSQAEVKRFIADLKSKPALMQGLKGKAAGIASVVAYATAAGYSITAADARDYVRSLSLQNLSDTHLDHLAGGKGGGKSVATTTASVQTAVSVTTAVQTAEVATTVATAGEIAVVAVAAVVLT